MKNYEELRQRSQTPRLLIVLVLPKEREEWLVFSPEELIARRCCYWHSLADAPEVPNQSSRQVRISKKQVFSPEQLRTLLIRASRFEEITNDV